MRGLAERHNLKVGDKFVVVGSKYDVKIISGREFTGSTILVCHVARDGSNINYTSKDTNGAIHNINLIGDSNDCRVRFPYKNELKKG